MGRTYLFLCSKCQYRAVVAGGADRALHCFIQTILCQNCAALYDAPVCLRVSEEEIEQPYRLWKRNLLTQPAVPVRRAFLLCHSRLAFGGSPKFHWIPVKFRCPVSVYHRVQAWNHPGKCPRCRSDLERTLTPYRIWD